MPCMRNLLAIRKGSDTSSSKYKRRRCAVKLLCGSVPIFFFCFSSNPFPDMPCVKRFTETNRRRYSGQQPGTKSARGPADKPRMNRLSTAGFVPPSVYIGFPLFVLAKRRSGQLSTIPWRARGTVGFLATRPVGILFCPALLRPAAPPCAAPTRTARGMFGFWTRQVLCSSIYGHALHEKV